MEKKKKRKAGKRLPTKAKTKKSKPKAKPRAGKRMAAKVASAAKAKRPVGKSAKPMPLNVSQMPSAGRKPKCLVLAGFGLNAEAELAYAFSLAGADVDIVHFSDISSGEKKLSSYDIFAIPGGWSFGDDLGGGRVLSNKLKNTFRADFEEFVAAGKPIIGICNGFQTLVKLGALPNISLSFTQESTLTGNESGKFEDRWVYLKPQKSACRYFEGVEFIHCPVRHGEGRFIMKDGKSLDELEKKGMVAVKYADEKMDDSACYPHNPNGSPRNIAGICDSTGKIFALMPHPECSVKSVCFPRFAEGISHEKGSIRFFENVVKAAMERM
jgi:phosphoribosylformylglycinamidine synthase I